MTRMKFISNRLWIFVILIINLTVLSRSNSFASESADPSSTSYQGRKGVTLFVSKSGNNTDGTSWKKGYHSIQAALSAIPDSLGGHRIIVRPDTYVEANLSTPFKGAKGAYNLLIGDSDGRLGSGATGRIIIDTGDPQQGFTVIVEDCVGIGRAFGGGVCYPIVRPDEPSVFRRCYFMALDWVGDTGAVLVGGWETMMPDTPHLVMEDCTLVHSDNALAMSYASNCVRVKAVGCRFIVLNFTQPKSLAGRVV